MRARIYMRPKTATQSGTATAGTWTLDYQTEAREVGDQLMGWWGGGSTQGQVRLTFDTADQAIAYAQANQLEYQLEHPPERKAIKAKAYADNFRYGRSENWTH